LIGLAFIVVVFVATTVVIVISGFTHRDEPHQAPVSPALQPAPAELVALLPAHVVERGVGMVGCGRL
jgi:hypothetical protein